MFITNNRASYHLWWKETLVKHQKVSKYYENDCRYIKLSARQCPRKLIRGHKSQNSSETQCPGFLILESQYRGFSVFESRCRGFLSPEKMPWIHDVVA